MSENQNKLLFCSDYAKKKKKKNGEFQFGCKAIEKSTVVSSWFTSNEGLT